VLEEGADLAFCTDAGTPGISDPGPALVTAAWHRGTRVVPIPGPSAVSTVLSVTGWPADRYVFLGFAPRSGKARVAWLERIQGADCPVVCFEAGNRVDTLLVDLVDRCGPGREIVVGREMTKRYEEFSRGGVEEIRARIGGSALKGEVTVVVSGREADPLTGPASGAAGPPAEALARALIRAGMERSRIAKVIAEVYRLSRNESYRMAMEATE